MSNNKKSSSVEWLMEKLIEHQIIKVGQTTYGGKVNYKHEILLEQAKAMHKEEMIQSYSNGWHDGQDIIINGITHIQVGGDAAGQEYYNETFGE